jgi:sulfatase modifying factor 1
LELVFYYLKKEKDMKESQYIQEVRQLIGTLKNADVRYKEEEDDARKIYESECNAANEELKAISKESEINLAAAKDALGKASSHYLLKEMSEIKISWEDIDKSFQIPAIANVDPKKELKKNVLNATQTTQKIEEKLEELHRFIDDQNRFIENQKKKRKRRNTYLILMSISAVILIFIVTKNIYRSWQLKSHYAEAVAAFEAKNWEKAIDELKKVFSITGDYENSETLFIESFYQLGVLSFESKQWEKARDIFNRLLNPFLLRRKGISDYKNAKSLLKESHFKINLIHKYRPTITVLETMKFVWISGGCFKMGSPPSEEGHRREEEPVHDVCVDGFWMGNTEVTNSQYRKFKLNHYSGDHEFNNNDQPVVMVSWEDAKAFAAWLTNNNKDGYKFRLPTEAEWEYAARAGTATSRYWGDNPSLACKYANVSDMKGNIFQKDSNIHNCSDGYGETSPVANYFPNNFGLHDMLGNVFEWCEDQFIPYGYDSIINPVNSWNEDADKLCIIRGGSWKSGIIEIRSAFRYLMETNMKNNNVGFRLVMTE